MLGVARRVDSVGARGQMPFFTQPYPLNLLTTCPPFFCSSAGRCSPWPLLDMSQGAQNSLPLCMGTYSRYFREGAQNSPH